MLRARELRIDGHTMAALAYNQDRSGTPIIFMHGITSCIAFWGRGQTPLVQERFRWYSLSLPGHFPAAFRPGMPREALTAERLAQIQSEAIRQLTGGAPAILAGHSTGGFMAINVAAHCPELVSAVISISGFANGRWTGPLGFYQWLVRRGRVGQALFRLIYRLCLLNLDIFRLAVGTYAADRQALYHHPDFALAIEALLPYARRLDLHAMAHYFHRMPEIDITPLLPQIPVPVLALAGDRDPIVPPQQARLIAQCVPQGELVLLEGAGHLPMLERAESYHRAITDFLISR